MTEHTKREVLPPLPEGPLVTREMMARAMDAGRMGDSQEVFRESLARQVLEAHAGEIARRAAYEAARECWGACSPLTESESAVGKICAKYAPPAPAVPSVVVQGVRVRWSGLADDRHSIIAYEVEDDSRTLSRVSLSEIVARYTPTADEYASLLSLQQGARR